MPEVRIARSNTWINGDGFMGFKHHTFLFVIFSLTSTSIFQKKLLE